MLSRAALSLTFVVLCLTFAPLYGQCPSAPGLTLETTSGPAGIDDVPTFADGNIARAADAVHFATHHRAGHDSSYVNDGKYGDASIIFFRGPDATSGEVYAGIYWTGGGQNIAEVAIGRDNTGGHANLVSSSYTFEYTTDVFTPTVCGNHLSPACDDSANVAPAVQWCPIGVANVHAGESDEEHRRRYSLNTPLTGVTAIRVVTTGKETIIDEIEVGDSTGSLLLNACVVPSFTSLTPSPAPAGINDVPTFDDGNIARAPDASTFSTHWRGPGVGHNSTFINDGKYGDGSIIYFRGPQATSEEVYAGIYWSGGGQTIAEVAIGRDNTGAHTNLISANYRFEYTTDDFTPTVCGDHTTPACDDSGNLVPKWCPMDLVNEHCPNPGSGANFCGNNDADAGLRRRYDVVPNLTGVRAIRVHVISTSGGTERCIDEIEVGEFDGSLLLDPCDPAPGLTLETTSGPVGIDDVPTFDDGNIARAADAVHFATHHRGGHDSSGINDGKYGDASIIFFRGPDATSGEVYAGIYWTGGGQNIAEVAIGRDNTGGHANLVSGSYTFEYTTDVFTPTVCGAHTAPPCDDSGNIAPTVKWCPLGVANAHNGESDAEHRRRYSLNTPLTGVTAIRVLTTGKETIIDEIEVGDSVGSLLLNPCVVPSVTLLETGGPEGTPAAVGDVPTFAAGNIARAPDATTFSTHWRSGHDSTGINDGNYGDASIIFFRGPAATSGEVYAGIYWSGGGQDVAEVAISRDNTGVETSLISATYRFEYTTDDFTPTVCGNNTTSSCDDSGNFVPKWCPMDLVNQHCPSPGSGANFCNTNPDAELRRRFDVVPNLTGVRAVRVIVISPSGGTERIIDEIEVGEFDGALGVEVDCNDNVDGDGDGDTDCADSDCAAAPNCNPEVNCNDNVDNDLDGDTDCADSDCVAAANCIPEVDCNDNVDNDLDGDTDCADSHCAMAANCNPEANCNDGVDDDLDGDTDCDDSDCSADASCVESACDDNVDNDGDGTTDCGDTDCAAEQVCLKVLVKPGDANGDGVLDGADPVAFLSWFFAGTDFPAPSGHELCLATPGDPDVITAVGVKVLDWNGDGNLDLADGIAQLTWTFSGGSAHTECVPTMSPPNCPNCIEVDNTNCIDTCTP